MYDLKSIYRASSVTDAIEALQQDPQAVVICGGSDVLIRIREGKLSDRPLVSIHGLPELSQIYLEPEGELVIGPAVPFAQVTRHPLIQRLVPALGEAVDQAGGPQLRNVGTIGGNICNGATSADSASTLLTLNAVVELTSPEGMRRVPLEEFYRGPGRVDLHPAELCTAIRIARKDYEGFYGHYIKYAQRNAMDIATLGVRGPCEAQPGENSGGAVAPGLWRGSPHPHPLPGDRTVGCGVASGSGTAESGGAHRSDRSEPAHQLARLQGVPPSAGAGVEPTGPDGGGKTGGRCLGCLN